LTLDAIAECHGVGCHGRRIGGWVITGGAEGGGQEEGSVRKHEKWATLAGDSDTFLMNLVSCPYSVTCDFAGACRVLHINVLLLFAISSVLIFTL
jgi:hypothetical protein